MELNMFYIISIIDFNKLKITENGKSILYPDLFFNYKYLYNNTYEIYISDYINIDFVNSIGNTNVTVNNDVLLSLAINEYSKFSKKYPEYIIDIVDSKNNLYELSILRFQ
jgi:hypothetical protein